MQNSKGQTSKKAEEAKGSKKTATPIKDIKTASAPASNPTHPATFERKELYNEKTSKNQTEVVEIKSKQDKVKSQTFVIMHTEFEGEETEEREKNHRAENGVKTKNGHANGTKAELPESFKRILKNMIAE